MSTTEEISAIDEKKTEETGVEPDFKGFIKNYLSSIIITIGFSVFVIGTIGLFYTKVAQANIIPDNIELAPYTTIDRVVKDIPIDINVMRQMLWSENKETLSQKAVFLSQDYLDSFNNSFLCYLKKNATPDAGIFANATLFFSHVYENVIAKNFLVINQFFFYLSYLPEFAIMLFYGMFGIIIWFILLFITTCFSIAYHVIHIPELFRTSDPENNSLWESKENISFFRIMKIILFFFVWIPLGLFSTFVSPFFLSLYSIFSPLFAKYEIKQQGPKIHGITDFIKDTFAYKKLFFFILATLSLVSNGIKYLGPNSIVGIAIAVLFAYVMGLYSNEMPESGTNGFSLKIRQNMKQAGIAVNTANPQLVKVCQPIPINDQKLKELESKGAFRPLSKPKNVGGDGDINEVGETMEQPPINETSVAPPIEPVDAPEMGPFNETVFVGGRRRPNKKYNIRLV